MFGLGKPIQLHGDFLKSANFRVLDPLKKTQTQTDQHENYPNNNPRSEVEFHNHRQPFIAHVTSQVPILSGFI